VTSRLARIVLAATVGVAVLAACGDSGFQYVKSSSDGSYLKVPDDWQLYDTEEVLAAQTGQTVTSDLDDDNGWAVAFDAAPEPTVLNVVSLSADHPTGVTQVRPITTFQQHDEASLKSLRNLDFAVDDLLSTGDAELMRSEELQTDAGHWGTRNVFAVRNPQGERIVIDQTAYYDQGATKVFSLTMSCSAACYADNEGTIDEIVESWTLEDR
jgi:hypothetical protein